jgi:excisionase family DNA binding protein
MPARYTSPAEIPDPAPDDLIPIGEAAKILCVSVDTMRRWADKDHIPSVRTPGKQRRFLRGDVLAFKAGAA